MPAKAVVVNRYHCSIICREALPEPCLPLAAAQGQLRPAAVEQFVNQLDLAAAVCGPKAGAQVDVQLALLAPWAATEVDLSTHTAWCASHNESEDTNVKLPAVTMMLRALPHILPRPTNCWKSRSI